MAQVAVAKQPRQAQQSPLERWAGFEAPLFRGSLFNMNPFALMRQFTEDMDRAFGPARAGGNGAAWSPAIEVKQEAGKLLINAELPGLKKDDIKVNITDDLLTLEGERKQEKEEKREGFYHSERSYGKFYRSIPLPDGADANNVKAEFSDGVLNITVPVAEVKPASRQIPVK